ncbi:F178B protein, partial [Phaetusa simplex]|nr:F178B protein [Phaetusa simplex]
EARPGPARAPRPEGLRWYQIPLSSARVPRSVIFSYGFQSGLRRYQQLRVHKRLPVGRPASLCPRGVRADPCAVPAAPRRSKKSPGTRKRVSRGRQPPGPAQPRANRRDAASRGSPACQVAPDRSSRVPVLPEVAVGSLGGEANGGQHTAARTVPQQAGRSSGGHPLGTERGWVSSTDSEDDELIPLKDMLLAGDEPPSPADHQQAARPQPDPLANSLDSLAQEQREQRQAATLPAGLAWMRVDDDSSWESPDEDTELPEEHRDFLAHYTMTPRFIPAVHPGEPIFCARSVPVPTLDTRGLKPQSVLEGFFLSNSTACQAAFVRDGGLSLLYRCVPTCPLPVLRWLFQVSHRHQRTPPPPTPRAPSRSLDPSCSPRQASPEATSTLALVTQLGDICKFLALCVVTQPCRYADGARLALVTLLSFLGLDRALRCQPLPELQHLLHCLLEGIGDWQQQVPRAGGSPSPRAHPPHPSSG